MEHLPDDLFPKLRQAGLLKAAVEQLNRDISFIDSGKEFSTHSGSPEQICDELGTYLRGLSDSNSSAFRNLLYRIDIPEKEVRNLKSQEGDFYKLLASLVLVRELKKVILRKYFSSGGKL